MLAQANGLVKERQPGQDQTQWKRRDCRWLRRVQSKEKGEQKELWKEEASSQLAFRSSFMNCRSALREELEVA